MKSIYVCTDYEGHGKSKKNKTKLCCELIALAGYLPMNPHLIMTSYLHYGDEQEMDIADDLTFEWLYRCDELWVVGLKLTQDMEIMIEGAVEHDIPVRFFDPGLHEVNSGSQTPGILFSEELLKYMKLAEEYR